MKSKSVFSVAVLLALAGSVFASLDINEVRIDESGIENNEYFELYANGMNVNLGDLTYLVIGDSSAGSGVIEEVVALPNITLNSGEYFLVAESSFNMGPTPDLVVSLNFEYDNVTHLVVRNFSGSLFQDLDTEADGGDGNLDITPWSEVIDAVSLLSSDDFGDKVYGAALGGVDVGGDGNFIPNHVYRSPDGGDFVIDDLFLVDDDTPGASNGAAAVPEPSAFLLLGLVGGVAGLGKWLRSRRQAAE